MMLSSRAPCACRSQSRAFSAARRAPCLRPIQARKQDVQETTDMQPRMAEIGLSTTLATLGMWGMSALPSFAEDAAVPEPAASFAGFNPAEIVILSSPIIIYAIFTVYRDRVNPKATIADLLLIVGLCIILANIFSIIVLKVRFF